MVVSSRIDRDEELEARSFVGGSADCARTVDDTEPVAHVPRWSMSRQVRPYRFGLILALTVFLGEASIMALLHVLPPMSAWMQSLIDAFLITGLLIPPLYVFMLRPLVDEVEQRKTAQGQVEKRNRELLAATRAEHGQRRLAEALTEAAVILNSSLNQDDVLDRILEQTQRIVPCRVIAILELDGDRVRVARSRGVPDDHPLGKGFPLDRFPRVQTVATSAWPLVIDDTAVDAEWSMIPGLEWVRSFVLAPMVAERCTIGFLATLGEGPGDFPNEVSEFLKTFAMYAAVAIHRSKIYQAEQQARKTAETLSTASMALTETLELQTVLHVLLDHLHRLIPFTVGSVLLMESESYLALRARVGYDGMTETDSVLPDEIDLLEFPHCQALLDSQHHVLAENCAEANAWLPNLSSANELSCLAVPILAGERSLGLCILETGEAYALTPEHARMAEAMVSQAAVAIQNAALFQQVRAGHARLQALSHRLVETQENERIQIARELHDEAGQMLASMSLALKMLEDNASEPSAVVEGVQELRKVANAVQENLSRLAMDLRPASLDYLGLVAALNTYVNNIADYDGIGVQFKAIGWSGSRLPAQIEIAVYRIAQEALNNVVRHAKAKSVDVLLQKDQHKIHLLVEDDGIGFDPSVPSTHLGLVGIRERCEMLDGRVVIESGPGQGTTLVVEIPYEDTHTGM